MLSVALRPKFLGLLTLMVAATVVCGLLANWQWDRAQGGGAGGAPPGVAGAPATPAPIETLLKPGDPVTNDKQGALVTLTGTFTPAHQALSPGRSINGSHATVVVSDFTITKGPLAGTHMPIARGWIAGDGSALTAPPTVPSGDVTITVALEASEGASESLRHGGPAGLITLDTISTAYLVNVWGSPMLSGYGAVTHEALDAAQEPAARIHDGLNPMPKAETEFSRGLNLQNFGYMLQWIAFGVFFLYIWWRSVRTAYKDELEERRLALEKLARGDAPTRGANPVSSTSPETQRPAH